MPYARMCKGLNNLLIVFFLLIINALAPFDCRGGSKEIYELNHVINDLSNLSLFAMEHILYVLYKI